MLKLKIISIGKTKENWLNEAIDEYIKRLFPVLQIEFILAKNDGHLVELLAKEPYVICLDSTGKMFDSEKFAVFLEEQFIASGSRLTMAIGGPTGLPTEIRGKYKAISLSPMTLTHQMVRLLLLEQIYRAFEIIKGSKYHK